MRQNSIEELLHDFLNEVLYLIFAKKKYIYKLAVKTLSLKENSLTADIHILNNIKQGKYILRELKSVTFHDLVIIKKPKFYISNVIIDL